MSTTQPPAPSDQTPPEGPRPGRAAPRVIALLTAALGVAVIVGTVWSGAAPTVAAASTRSEERTAEVAGVTAIDVDITGTALTVVFADVDDASLTVQRTGGGSWTLERDGATLRVETPRGPFVSWFGRGNGQATLTLPRELEGSDAQFSLGAGSVVADGTFGALGLDLGAGEVHVTGRAESLSAQLSAGRADIDLAGVADATLDLNAGAMVANLTGAAPDSVKVTVNAGSLDLTLPDEAYDVSSDVAVGEFDNGLRVETGSDHRVSVEVSAGDARIQAG